MLHEGFHVRVTRQLLRCGVRPACSRWPAPGTARERRILRPAKQGFALEFHGRSTILNFRSISHLLHRLDVAFRVAPGADRAPGPGTSRARRRPGASAASCRRGCRRRDRRSGSPWPGCGVVAWIQRAGTPGVLDQVTRPDGILFRIAAQWLFCSPMANLLTSIILMP